MIQLFPAKLQTFLATTGLTLAIGAASGAAAVLAWEHQTPWGLARKLDAAQTVRDTAVAERDEARRGKAACVAETWRWSGAYDRLSAARQADADAAAAALAARAEDQARQCRAAYQSGVTAGRALGPRGTDATSPDDPGRPGGVDAGGVSDDLAGAWRSGAYRPGSGG